MQPPEALWMDLAIWRNCDSDYDTLGMGSGCGIVGWLSLWVMFTVYELTVRNVMEANSKCLNA
jgi:hypothetical protein